MQVICHEQTEEKPNNSIDFNFRKKHDGLEPFKGMIFESLDEASCFYYAYAQIQGFNVRIRNSTYFPRSKEIRYRRYVCSCEGYCSEKEPKVDEKKEKKTLTIRKGFSVNFTVSRKSSTTHWVAINIENVHSHMLVSPRSAKNLRNQKAMPNLVKNLVERFSEAGLPTGRVSDIVSGEPEVNISSRDCWNHMRNLSIRNLDLGDAESVFRYCRMKQVQDPNFYYSIMPDKESRMVNFFWVDSKGILCRHILAIFQKKRCTKNTDKIYSPKVD
jgi:FAR1 DNA-binding domain